MSCQIAPSPIIVRNEHLSSSPSSVSVDKESLHTCQSSFADDDNSDDYYELPSNVADELCKRTEAREATTFHNIFLFWMMEKQI